MEWELPVAPEIFLAQPHTRFFVIYCQGFIRYLLNAWGDVCEFVIRSCGNYSLCDLGYDLQMVFIQYI